MLDKLTVSDVLTSIGVAELIESYTAFEMDKFPADHELINLSPDMSILERENPFAWHQDDYGAVNYKVNTIIYYLRKDKTIRNGNLKYKINDIEATHIVKKGDILCFRGDLWHYPETSTGFGCRDIIVVFIKRNN